jgi:hypothetical protein
MKVIMSMMSLFLAFQMNSQKLPVIVKDISVFNEYSNAIKSLCNDLKDDVNNQLKTEILSYSYHNVLSQFNQNKKFNKLFKNSTETITMAVLSKEYGIEHTFVSLSNGRDTYIFSMSHESNKANFVCNERNNNTFFRVVESLDNSIYPGCILIVKRYPDHEGVLDIKYGLSIATMQTPFYLEKFAKNIK